MSKIKERVFGLIVVISLGVIFGPMLLQDHPTKKALKLAQDQSAADKAVPEQQTDQAAPEQAAPEPEQPAPEQPAPEQPAPEQPAPEPEQPAPEQPAPEQPVPEQPAPEQGAPKQPTPEQGAPKKPAKEPAKEPTKEPAKDPAKDPTKEQKGSPTANQAHPQSGWVVQMGLFASQDNANTLLKKLQAKGYPAFVKNVKREGETLTVVLVGPRVRKEESLRLRNDLVAKFEINGMIVRYEER